MAMICLVSQWILNGFSVLLLFAAGPPLPHTSFFIILIIRDWVRLIMERFAIFEEGQVVPCAVCSHQNFDNSDKLGKINHGKVCNI